MMFKSLHIQNFQSHEDTRLDFDPGVNVIIGQSDSGKSSILRALNWVINNRPMGLAFRSNWCGKNDAVDVSLEDTQSNKIVRKKSESENTYIIYDADGDGKGLNALNKGVPDEISTILNMKPLNFQRQLDAPFLLSQTPGEVAKTLNEVVNLDVIDSALVALKRDTQAIRGHINQTKEAMDDLEAKKAELSTVHDVAGGLTVAESICKDIGKYDNKLGALNGLIVSAESASRSMDKYKNLDRASKSLDSIFTTLQRVSECSNNVATLKQLIDKQKSANEALNRLADVDDALDLLSDARKQAATALKLQDKCKRLVDAIKAVEGLKKRILDLDGNIDNMESELYEIMPDVCPFCGQEIKR